MSADKTPRQNRVREALDRIYDQHTPLFGDYLRRYKEDPTSRVFAPLAEAYRKMGRVDEAIQVCKTGLDYHPDFHGGRVTLARALSDKKSFREAKQELEKVIQVAPENLAAQKLLGEIHLKLRNVEGALHCFKMALLLAPSDVALSDKVHQLEKDRTVYESKESEADPELIQVTDAAQDEEGMAMAMAPDEAPSQEPASQPLPEATIHFAPANWDGYGFPQKPAENPVEQGIDAILGYSEADREVEAFHAEHVSEVFGDKESKKGKEINTETLGDLYYVQGQYERSLKIFEKLHTARPTAELSRKINACRTKLGVDKDSLLRTQQAEMLRSILKKNRENFLA